MIISDVSFYQYKYFDNTQKVITEYIDFAKMRTLSPAVIIRAGQNLWRDIAFHISWKNAKDAGLLRGSYWFYDSRADPKKQAQLWVDVLDGDLGELPMWCDFEDRYGGQYHGWRHWYNFMTELERLVPNKQLGIYTGFYYWKENLSAPLATISQRDYFRKYPLWIANYNPVDAPLIPEPFDTWVFWQYTDNGNGETYGVASGNIDLNYFNGSEADFHKMFGGVSLPQRTMKAKFGNTIVEYRNV